MRDCLRRHAQASEQELASARTVAADAVLAWDEEKRFVAAAQARLDTSARAFLRYRAAQCAWSQALGGGAIGNAIELRRLACVAALNYWQSSQLRSAVAALPHGHKSQAPR